MAAAAAGYTTDCTVASDEGADIVADTAVAVAAAAAAAVKLVEDSTHCYSCKTDMDDFSCLHCMCWSMDCWDDSETRILDP
jgi:hypothetical protein